MTIDRERLEEIIEHDIYLPEMQDMARVILYLDEKVQRLQSYWDRAADNPEGDWIPVGS
jgi:hypothetical protein